MQPVLWLGARAALVYLGKMMEISAGLQQTLNLCGAFASANLCQKAINAGLAAGLAESDDVMAHAIQHVKAGAKLFFSF